MAVEIKMPQLSDTMSAGKILAWKKQKGDQITRGDILAEVETEKANLEIESFHNGTLLEINIPAGESAKVGEVIAMIGSASDQLAVTKPSVATTNPNPIVAVVTEQHPTANATTPVITHSTSERIKISPLARKVAEQNNIDISNLQGSGPNGRIVKKDVVISETGSGTSLGCNTNLANENNQFTQNSAISTAPQIALVKTEASSVASSSSAPVSPVSGSGKYTAFSKMRETIARRMQESVQQSPHFYATTSIDMTEAKRLREILKEMPEYKGISINHFVIKAAAYAIAREPRVNCAVKNGQIYEPESINIGIITAIEDGLLIPVIKETDKLPLKDLVFEAKAAVDRARAGRPSAADLSGGTFSISNMGMYDVENFTAIINPGQGGILAVSASKEEPVVRDGQIAIRLMMKVTISVDHRIIDGIMSATFLKHFKAALETPALLMA